MFGNFCAWVKETWVGGCLQRIDTEELLTHLPGRLAKKVRDLATRLKRTPLQIIEKGIALQHRYASEDKELTNDEKLAKVAPDPLERRIYLRIDKLLRQLRAAEIPEKTRKKNAAAGGRARADNTKETRRKEIARMGAAQRKRNFDERKAKEQQQPPE